MKSERWATPQEIMNALTPDSNMNVGGQVLYCRNGHYWVYGGEGHSLITGVTGAGKSRRGTIPTTLSYIRAKRSFAVVDPKGEIYRKTYYRLGKKYKKIVLNFRRIFESDGWEPLHAIKALYLSNVPEKRQRAIELIDGLAHSLFLVSDNADPFWAESAQSLFIGVVYALLECAKPEEINMQSVFQFVVRGEEHVPGGIRMKEFVDKLPADSVASMMLQSYANTAHDTRAGIRSTFLQGISLFVRSDGLMEMMGREGIRINELDGETPTAIYIILPDESPIYDSLAGVFVSQLLEHYIYLAEDQYNGRLPRPLEICLEELGNIGRSIETLPHLLSAGRSRGVRVQMVLQSLSQLDTIYGPSAANTIRSNCDVIVAFRTNQWETLTELSQKCGQREVWINGNLSQESLITPAQLGAMETGQALVMISGRTKFITWLPDYEEIFDCSGWKEPPHRKRLQSARLPVFDIRTYKMEATDDSDTKRWSPFRHVIEPFSNPSVRPTPPAVVAPPDMDSLLAEIDAESNDFIARVMSDEIKLSDLEDSGTSTTNKGRYAVTLESAGESYFHVVKAVQKATKLGLAEAMKAVENLPHRFEFRTKKEVATAMKLFSEAGAIATETV